MLVLYGMLKTFSFVDKKNNVKIVIHLIAEYLLKKYIKNLNFGIWRQYRG